MSLNGTGSLTGTGWLRGVFVAVLAAFCMESNGRPCVSGVYPHLAYSNNEGECGTGAVVPWAGSLWVVTYGPHSPCGSSDKLYQITPDLRQNIRPESVGGTHANRLIHRESQQLLIGTYLVDKIGNVRTVPIHTMPGRLTGVARHLVDPRNKLYVTDMEEALYELDVNSLDTFTRIRDGHNRAAFEGLFKRLDVKPPRGWDSAEESDLFGYHGKGTCSGFGKVFYANNGWYTPEAMRNPTIPAGALVEWRPNDRQWTLIRTNQFTEVTTRDGIYGNEHPDANVIWAMGWDHKSVILAVTDDGRTWHDYRLPKGSHCYDGAHGWNTEWPRIREIGDKDNLLATMHGTFWKFPASFGPKNAKGIRPYSNYLKVVGDFCAWNGKVVFGCDDSARNEFMNKRRAKGGVAGPESSNSNLWFVDPKALGSFGPALGRGSVWHEEPVKAGAHSDAYLLAGYDRRTLYVTGGLDFDLEVDADGSGHWARVDRKRRCPQYKGSADVQIVELDDLPGEWVRLVAKSDTGKVTAFFNYANEDRRSAKPDKIFEGLCFGPTTQKGDLNGLVRSGAASAGLPLKFLDTTCNSVRGYYEIDGELTFNRVADVNSPQVQDMLTNCAAQVNGSVRTAGVWVDAASALVVDDDGRRWRLPRRGWHIDGTMPQGEFIAAGRICREVCTERDLMNVGGNFYELPAENAGGMAMIRPVGASAALEYPRDYCSWRGLLVMTGIERFYKGTNPRILRAADKNSTAAVWLGVADDLWKMGKPRGKGGPWLKTAVKLGEPSDPYLMTGFDRKRLTLEASAATTVALEIDVTGRGTWATLRRYEVKPGGKLTDDLSAIRAYWLRFVSSTDCTVTAQLNYE